MPDPLSLASSVAGLASLVLQIATVLSGQVSSIKDAPSDARALLDELDLFWRALVHLETFVQSHEGAGAVIKSSISAIRKESALDNALLRCISFLEKLRVWVERLERGGLKGGGYRIAWHLRKESFKEKTEELHQYVTTFQGCASMNGITLMLKSIEELKTLDALQKQGADVHMDSHRQHLTDILSQLQSLSLIGTEIHSTKAMVTGLDDARRNTEHLQALKWISDIDMLERQRELIHSALPGTGSWFLEAILKDWVEKDNGGLLWCSGPPGAGKTILTSLVINLLLDQYSSNCSAGEDVALAWFYCDYAGGDKSQTTEDVFSCLLRQIIECNISLMDAVMPLYRDHKTLGFRKPRLTLAEMIKLWTVASQRYKRIFIVIDAFNESSEAVRRPLLEALQHVSPSHLMITSRDHVGVSTVFSDGASLSIRMLANKQDLALYARSRLSSFRSEVWRDVALCDQIIWMVVEKSAGLFIACKLLTDALASKFTVAGVRRALLTLPSGINRIYDDIGKRILEQSPEACELALRILSHITRLRRTLSLAEAQHLLAFAGHVDIDEEDVVTRESILSVCMGIVIHDPKKDAIRFTHHTAKEYVEYLIGMEALLETDKVLARLCLRYLFDLSALDAQVSCDADHRLYHPQYALSDYVLRYWGDHTRVCDNAVTAEALSVLESQPTMDFYVRHARLAYIRASRFNWISRARRSFGFTSLHAASLFGLASCIPRLLENGANPNTKDGWGVPSLYDAAENGHSEIVSRLIQAGADINAEGGYLGNALQAASFGGYTAIAKLLLGSDANVLTQCGHFGNALQAAAFGGHQDAVLLLLTSGANVNMEGGYFGNALQAASFGGHAETVLLLLEHQSDVNTQGGQFGNALQAAASEGHADVLALLLQRGACVNARGGEFESALQAASAGGHEMCATILLEHGADVNTEGGYYGTAIRATAWNGHEQLAVLLLEHDADPTTHGGQVADAIQVASIRGHHNIASLLGAARRGMNQVQSTILPP